MGYDKAANPTRDIQAEMVTKFAAIEFLFPIEMRASSKIDVAKGVMTTYALAEHFDIPEHVVQYALSDKYMEYSNNIWGLIKPK